MNKTFLKIFVVCICAVFEILIVRCTEAQNSSNNMRLLANLNQHPQTGLYSALWGYLSPAGREYALLGCWDGTSFVDLTDTNNINESAFLPGPGSCCREMKTFSHYAYIVADGVSSGLQIVDLQYLPDSIHLVNTFYFNGFTRGHTISQDGACLYISAGDYKIGGVFVLNLSNDPEHPVKRGEWETQVVHDCRVINDTIWGANIYDPPGTISIIDATNKDSLRTITEWRNEPHPGPHNIAFTKDRKYALVTDEINGSLQNPRMLKIWDVRNIFNVIKISEWHPTGITTSIIHNVETYSHYALIAHYTAGVRVVDIQNPLNPLEKAWYDTYPPNDSFSYDGCWAVYKFPSDKIIASDRSNGLFVLKTSFSIEGGITPPPGQIPLIFELKQNYPNPFNPNTTIAYSIVSDSYVTIKIYDAGGKQVKLLQDGFQRADRYNLSFDATGLASGVYFYTMKAGSFTDAKKMVLVK